MRNITVRGNSQVIVSEDTIFDVSMQCLSQEYVKFTAISLHVYMTFRSLSVGKKFTVHYIYCTLHLFRLSSRALFLQLSWVLSQEKFAIPYLVEHVRTISLNVWYREEE